MINCEHSSSVMEKDPTHLAVILRASVGVRDIQVINVGRTASDGFLILESELVNCKLEKE